MEDVIAKLLPQIFAQSWQMEEVPKDWRKANITPILKKGKEKDPGNYGQVNLTSVPVKGDGTACVGNHFQAQEPMRRG